MNGHVFAQLWPTGPAGRRRDQVISCQYKADRARQALRGISEQVAEAEKAVAGATPIKRNRFVQLSGGTRSVNRRLDAKAGGPGRAEGLRHQPAGPSRRHPVTAQCVTSAYHRLPGIEKAFEWSEATCKPGPLYHRKRDSIEAHLTIVFAALAVSHWIETTTGWSIRKFVRTARRYRTMAQRSQARSGCMAASARARHFQWFFSSVRGLIFP